jgi:hypothetical protein
VLDFVIPASALDAEEAATVATFATNSAKFGGAAPQLLRAGGDGSAPAAGGVRIRRALRPRGGPRALPARPHGRLAHAQLLPHGQSYNRPWTRRGLNHAGKFGRLNPDALLRQARCISSLYIMGASLHLDRGPMFVYCSSLLLLVEPMPAEQPFRPRSVAARRAAAAGPGAAVSWHNLSGCGRTWRPGAPPPICPKRTSCASGVLCGHRWRCSPGHAERRFVRPHVAPRRTPACLSETRVSRFRPPPRLALAAAARPETPGVHLSEAFIPPRAAVAATEHGRTLGADLSEPCGRPSPPHRLFAPPLQPDRPVTMPNQRSKSPFRLPTEPCLDPPSPVCKTVPLPGTRDEARHGGTPSAAPRRGTRN